MTGDLANAISEHLGFSRTEQLGKYLGVPLLHSRVNKATYEYLVERIRLKLTGWNASTLSLAGRITLANSVLRTIPLYAMLSSKLPSSICSQIDKLTRYFIWNSNGS